jgi:hypothetical protein
LDTLKTLLETPTIRTAWMASSPAIGFSFFSLKWVLRKLCVLKWIYHIMKKKKIITGTYILTAFEDGTVFLATTGQRDFNYQFDNAKITGIMQANVNPMLRKVSLYYLLSTAFHKNEYFFPALTIKSQILAYALRWPPCNYTRYKPGLTLINTWGIFTPYSHNQPPQTILRNSVVQTSDCKGFHSTFHPKNRHFFIHKN